jgi:radical SAM-linked protein
MSTGFRLRVAFRKAGRLRFLSHLEVARALERTVRRAALPYAITQGFNPHMRVAFGPALPVGAAGDAEVFDVWLREFVPPAEVLSRLQASAPDDLAPTRARYVGDDRASLSAGVIAAHYTIVLSGAAEDVDALAAAFTRVASDETMDVTHKGKTRTFDPREEVLEPPVVTPDGEDAVATLLLALGQQGSLRPDAVVAKALEYSGHGATHAVVTRTGLLEEHDGALTDPLD